MNQSIKIVLLLLMSTFITGCTLLNGRPKPPINVEVVAEKLAVKLEEIDINDIDTNTVIKRNMGITNVLVVIDFRYSEFINNAGLEQRVKSITTDFVLLSLNLAGTAVGGAGIKTLLAALSAGVAGTNMAFDKSVIYETTVPALIMQMNADRTEKYRQILSGMNREIVEYSWAQAVRDLIDYYNAGTLQNAINSIKKNAGNKQVTEEKAIEKIVMLPKPTAQNVNSKHSLSESSRKIVAMNDNEFDKVKKILAPLRKALINRDGCKDLNSDLSRGEVTSALQECIRHIGEGGGSIDNDIEIFKENFLQAGLLLKN